MNVRKVSSIYHPPPLPVQLQLGVIFLLLLDVRKRLYTVNARYSIRSDYCMSLVFYETSKHSEFYLYSRKWKFIFRCALFL